MKLAGSLVACISFLSVAACSTNRVELAYRPTSAVVITSAATPVSVGSFVDQRGETATWFGAIRGGYGNPLKVMEANPSVSVLVQRAFSDGLRARGLQNSDATAVYQISGVIKQFDCSQYVRREAHAIIDVAIFDSATGKQVFSQTYTSDELDGSLLALNVGVFGNVETLRALAEKALTEVVDKALDDTALRNSMRKPI